MKSYFMLSEVIFGLREEYKKNEKSLGELLEYSKLKSQGSNLHFGVVNGSLTYDYTLNNRDLFWFNKRNLCGSFVKKSKDHYESDETLEITDLNKFNEISHNILNSEFNRNISLVSNINQVDDANKIVHIRMLNGSIHVNLDSFLGLGPTSLHYFSSLDKLVFDIRKCCLFTMEASDLLDTSIFSIELPFYHKKIINNNYGKRNYTFATKSPVLLNSSFDIDDIDGVHVLKKQKKKI